MADKASNIRVSKLDAACRQLRTAITLWFTGGDPIAIHTLAFAAYEVLHHLSKKRDPYRRDLIFDSDPVKTEHLGDWNKLIRKHANFFKHADRDGDSVIEFSLSINEFFMMFAIVARGLCGEPQSEEESIFNWWIMIHKPHILTENGQKSVSNALPGHNLEQVRGLSQHEFFDIFREARTRARTIGHRFSLPV